MKTNEKIEKMRKRNLKLFPIYKILAWDYLFFYTIDFLFLTQVKNISAADVVLKATFYSMFGIFLQIPSNIIIEFLGRKRSLILGNILNCCYIIILIFSKNLADLIVAELFSAIAFSIKNVVEPSILSSSILPSKNKHKIYSKLNSKGISGHYILGAITKIIAGFLFSINGYIPMILSLITLIISVFISMFFIEPIENKKINIDTIIGKNEIIKINEGFKFVFKSERLKALILSSSLICAIFSILSNYEVSLLKDIGLSSAIIGIFAAVKGMASAYASKRESKFHSEFTNKSLTIISYITSIAFIISGICALIKPINILLIFIILVMYVLLGFSKGLYNTLSDRYLSNFANKDIDTKIFAVNKLATSITRVIAGLIASVLLGRFETAYCMIIIGVIFTILFILAKKYMKTRVGLNPEKYSKLEKKYDELKEHYEIREKI